MEQPQIQTAYNEVVKLIEWRRYKDALARAEQLLTYDPEDADLYALLSRIYLLMDEYDKALHAVNESLKREPEHLHAWYVRVCVYYETERLEEFDEAVQEALRIDPYEAHYYFLIANRLLKQNQMMGAKEQLEKSLELEPENSLYLATMSYVEALLNHKTDSISLEKQALRDGVEDPHVLLYLAWAANTRGDFALQESYMRNAVRLQPEDKQMQDEYLEALQNQNKIYRLFIVPMNLVRRLKPWQIFISWIIAWALFKPLIIVILVLYVLTHWVTKAIVHVRVFGWRRRGA